MKKKVDSDIIKQQNQNAGDSFIIIITVITNIIIILIAGKKQGISSVKNGSTPPANDVPKGSPFSRGLLSRFTRNSSGPKGLQNTNWP